MNTCSSDMKSSSGRGSTGANAQRVNDGLHDLTAFNGYPNQYDHEQLRVAVGESVRFCVLNTRSGNPINFHVVGEVFDTVFVRGGTPSGTVANRPRAPRRRRCCRCCRPGEVWWNCPSTNRAPPPPPTT